MSARVETPEEIATRVTSLRVATPSILIRTLVTEAICEYRDAIVGALVEVERLETSPHAREALRAFTARLRGDR